MSDAITAPESTLKGWEFALPSGWSSMKLKHVAQIRLSNVDKKTVEGERRIRLCNYVDVYYHDFITPDMEFMEASASAAQIARFGLRRGDVLITKDSEAWDDIAVPACVEEDFEDVICGYHLAHLRPYTTIMYGPFLFRAIGADGVRDHFRFSANGITRYGISLDDISTALIPVPPLPEQRSIAAFLDRKTAQIDAVVAKKQRLIERLQEKRQALISHAVTKGLDPHAPMKDSGIEWLGKIPRHWTAERLKFSITKIEQGWSPQCDNRQAEDGEWGVLKVGCVNRSEFDSNEQKALPEELAPVAQYEIGEGDILMSRGNTRELVGSAALVKAVRPKLLLCDLLYRFRSRPQKADSQFLVLQLRSPVVRYQIEREATGTSASMKKIGQETIRSFWIVLPPIEEQQRIIVHIAEQAEYIDKMTDRIRTQICKLQEYRQTLISAAVTGKIDVTKEASA